MASFGHSDKPLRVVKHVGVEYKKINYVLNSEMHLRKKRVIWQARSKQTLFGQAIISASVVCVLCTHTNLGGSGGMTPRNFFEIYTLENLIYGVFCEI